MDTGSGGGLRTEPVPPSRSLGARSEQVWRSFGARAVFEAEESVTDEFLTDGADLNQERKLCEFI